MRWLQTEYILKGVFLGLLLDVALRQAALPPDSFNWTGPIRVGICLGVGLALALLLGAIWKFWQGYRVHGRLGAFILFLILESPGLVYVGILAGMLAGAFWEHDFEQDETLLLFAGGGAVLGIAFMILRFVKDQWTRVVLSGALGGGLAYAAVHVFGLREDLTAQYEIRNAVAFGVFLLMGLPVFYLLTFAGLEEESEAEVGAMAGTLGLGLVLISRGMGQAGVLAFGLPILLYFWYTLRIMPGLRVSKHYLRGVSHASVGRYRPALLALRRAVQLDPKHKAAREEYWRVHLSLDINMLAKDAQLQALVDFQLCIDRAGSLLLESTPPPERLAEAHRLLDLVQGLRPNLQPAVDYWRAIARIHEHNVDEAVALLANLLDPTKHAADDVARRSVLLPAWQLALMWHEELRHRVGQPQLELPGRRMEAIAAVERHWAETPDDPGVWPLKRLLYQDLSTEEYEAACAKGQPPAEFDYGYVQQLGNALIDDPNHWERGRAYLAIAAFGQPLLAPTLYTRIAGACEKAGRRDEMLAAHDMTRKIGLMVGHKNLAEQERQSFFRAVKLLGEDAMARGDNDTALDLFHLYGEYERSGIETLRTIAELFERKGDALAALRVVDRALVYDANDPDLQVRRDKYYYSTTPEVVRANLEVVRSELDLTYCATRAKEILDNPHSDLDSLDWAEHLIDLALVVKPESRPIRVLKARVYWRRGDTEKAAGLLEAVRTPKPEKFVDGEDEDAWFVACQILGDLYLNNLGRPADAVTCLTDYRKYPKSGARTYLRLGQAYEQLGDVARAVKCYKQAASYDGNPLQWEAQDALSRLGQP